MNLSFFNVRAIPVSVAVALASLVALVPVWSADIPPLLDYHNHLARQYILARFGSSEILRQFYHVSWHASPYLALDGIIQGFASFLPVDVAGKVFLSLMLLLMALAPIALNLALFGRVTPIALLGLLFIHNETVTLGFVNYLFSIGFALCLLALWIRLREAAGWVRLLLFPLLCSLLFFSHLLGYMIYLLTIGSYELGCHLQKTWRHSPSAFWKLDSGQWHNLLSIILQAVLPLLIFSLYGPSAESVSSNTHGGLVRKLDLLLGMFGYLIPPYAWSVDKAVALALPVVLAGLLIARRLFIPGPMLWVIAAMLVLFLVMPMELFSGWGADHRLLPALGLLLIGSIAPTKQSTGWLGVLGTALILGLVLVRAGAVTLEWRKSNQDYAEYVAAFETIPNGSRMFYAFGHRGMEKEISIRPVYHLPLLLLARRDVYVPFLFASNSGSFTLQYRPGVEPLQHLSKGPVLLGGQSPDWGAIQDQFDYVFLVNQTYFDTPVPKAWTQVFAGKNVKVYKTTVAKDHIAATSHAH